MATTLAANFLIIEKLRGFDRSAWNATMQPLLFQTAGLASAIADRHEHPQRGALIAVAKAIIELMPPDEQGIADDAGWIRIEVAITRAREAFDP
jgi:hypothetical protein